LVTLVCLKGGQVEKKKEQPAIHPTYSQGSHPSYSFTGWPSILFTYKVAIHLIYSSMAIHPTQF
jgi:hypothetical protein